MHDKANTFKHVVSPSDQVGFLLIVLTAIFFLLFSGCKDSSLQHPTETEDQREIVIDEIAIPVLPSSEEQFNYTRSWFAEKQLKHAALEAYLQLYPENKRYCGLAALDLAYLQLGDDYRFASDKSYFNALQSYQAILQEYDDFPEIMAKALWYIGWISTDLLYDRQKGLAAYRRVVEEYPHEGVFLLPPAPWVSIIYPQEEQGDSTIMEFPGSSWAALALVEIIKHTEDQEAAWASFKRLWRNYRNDSGVGFALRHVLQRRYHVAEAKAMALEFMEKNLSNVHLLSDIRKEVIAIDSRGVSAHED